MAVTYILPAYIQVDENNHVALSAAQADPKLREQCLAALRRDLHQAQHTVRQKKAVISFLKELEAPAVAR